MEELTSKSRTRTLVTARQIAMYLCRELTDMSLPKIGQELGGRDHTTVIHADRKIRELMAERRAIYNQVTELTNRIKQQQRYAEPFRSPAALGTAPRPPSSLTHKVISTGQIAQVPDPGGDIHSYPQVSTGCPRVFRTPTHSCG